MDKGYYKNIGMDAATQLNTFDTKLQEAQELVNHAVEAGEIEPTDDALSMALSEALNQMFEAGEFGNMSPEEFSAKVSKADLGMGVEYIADTQQQKQPVEKFDTQKGMPSEYPQEGDEEVETAYQQRKPLIKPKQPMMRPQ